MEKGDCKNKIILYEQAVGTVSKHTELFNVMDMASANPMRYCKAGEVVGLFVDTTIPPPTTKIHNDVNVDENISLVSLNRLGNDLV